MKVLHSYENGDFFNTLLEDGTLIRQWKKRNPMPAFPSSIDIKITDYCDMGCNFCHEKSTVGGKHGDLKKLGEILEILPAGVELAIGGGNPLDHPDLIPFLGLMKERGLICNITVNSGHLGRYGDLLLELIDHEFVKGVGISINRDLAPIKRIAESAPRLVYHVIMGAHDISILDNLHKFHRAPILVLGYKIFGKGVDYYNERVLDSVNQWKIKIPDYLGKVSLSFDNLALHQLNLRSILSKERWDRTYMGDDFTHSMYIDAVEGQYAPTSTSVLESRKSWDRLRLVDFFLIGK